MQSPPQAPATLGRPTYAGQRRARACPCTDPLVITLTTSSGTCRGSLSWLSLTMVATVLSVSMPSRVLDHVLQIEILDREVVVAVLVGAAHRLVVGLAHLVAHARPSWSRSPLTATTALLIRPTAS